MLKGKRKTNRVTENPTLEEIRRRCAQIQSGWSDQERIKRAGIVPTTWQPPLVSKDDSFEIPTMDAERN